MTDQEFREYYDQACIEAGMINAPNTRIAMHLVLQLIAHLNAQKSTPPAQDKQSG